LAMQLESTFLPLSTAAAVSSQDDSIAKISSELGNIVFFKALQK
jgi:hypothetical protein